MTISPDIPSTNSQEIIDGIKVISLNINCIAINIDIILEKKQAYLSFLIGLQILKVSKNFKLNIKTDTFDLQ